jgi:hypothetical protein
VAWRRELPKRCCNARFLTGGGLSQPYHHDSTGALAAPQKGAPHGFIFQLPGAVPVMPRLCTHVARFAGVPLLSSRCQI